MNVAKTQRGSYIKLEFSIAGKQVDSAELAKNDNVTKMFKVRKLEFDARKQGQEDKILEALFQIKWTNESKFTSGQLKLPKLSPSQLEKIFKSPIQISVTYEGRENAPQAQSQESALNQIILEEDNSLDVNIDLTFLIPFQQLECLIYLMNQYRMPIMSTQKIQCSGKTQFQINGIEASQVHKHHVKLSFDKTIEQKTYLQITLIDKDHQKIYSYQDNKLIVSKFQKANRSADPEEQLRLQLLQDQV